MTRVKATIQHFEQTELNLTLYGQISSAMSNHNPSTQDASSHAGL